MSNSGRTGRPTMELIPPHRRRAFLRKAFDRLVEIIQRPAITAGEVLQALNAYERCVSMSTNTASEQLAKAILEPDALPEAEFWKELHNVVKAKYGVELPVPN
jgi:hypothetical protein